MFRVSRLLPLLVAATAAGCVYPDLKMGTSTGGAGGATTPGGLGGASGGSATGGTHSSGGVTGTGGSTSTGGATSVADARAAGGATSADVAPDTLDAPRTVDAPAAVDALRAVDAPAAIDAPAAADAPAAVDVPGEGGGGARDAGGEAGETDGSGSVCYRSTCGSTCTDLTADMYNCGRCGNACSSGQRCSGGACLCDWASCPGSCCNGNVCVASQTPSMCGSGGTQCSACGPTGTTVTFDNGKAAGAMTGWAWVAAGSLDTVTDPTCKGTDASVTGPVPCPAGTNWSPPSALCVSGSLPALSASNPDYANNWGITLGITATINQDGRLGDFGQTLGQSFTSIAIAITTGSSLSGIRAQVTRRGDPIGAGYCAIMTPGTAIPFTSFNTKCYDTPPDGVALTLADVPNIDGISVQVPSGSTAITVTDLCITGITFSM